MLSKEQREALMIAGFMRVDGLRATMAWETEKTYVIDGCDGTYIGRYDQNNGTIVIYTLNGEIWVADADAMEKIRPLLPELCPNGRGCHVPFSNGETIHPHELMHKAADSDYVTPGH